jgi:hypothetical protein
VLEQALEQALVPVRALEQPWQLLEPRSRRRNRQQR